MNRLLVLLIVVTVLFRFIGLNWDSGQHLHPDERFLTMVGQAITWPKSIGSYFSTISSTANPHNIGFPFFVYGTLPLFVTKLAAQLLLLDSYTGITLVGRGLSALLDSFLIFIVYLISRHLSKIKTVGLLSSLFYGLSVLPIQLSHYFAVDTFLVFFLYLSFLLMHLIIQSDKPKSAVFFSLGLGVVYGLALASKISAVLFLPVILSGLGFRLFKQKSLSVFFKSSLVFLMFAGLTLRLTQPYLFTGSVSLNPRVLANWQQLKSFEDKSGWFPPAVQWIYTLPLLFPLENLLLWGLGPFMFLVAVFSLVSTVRHLRSRPEHCLHLIWIIGLFIYQGFQLAKPMRYFYPFYPSLAILAGPVLYYLLQRKSVILKMFVLTLLFYWPVSFISIYLHPHPRVAATTWINGHLSPGSTISCEYWDDCLPLGGPGPYNIIELSLYNRPDNPEKWTQLNSQLARTDYLILSSNRLYGSIMAASDLYPLTGRFYSDLFSGRLGFTKIAEFSSRPNLPFPGFRLCLTPPFISYGKVAYSSQECPLSGISFVDDYADETFTVYDHPKVLIFKRHDSKAKTEELF